MIVSTGVEVVLLKKLHKELRDKKKRMGQMNGTKASSGEIISATAVENLLPFRKRRRQKIEEGTEKRALMMVVINALINFFFRLPDLFFLFATSNQLLGTNNFFTIFFLSFPSLTNFTTDLTYFMYILTFSTKFLIYYVFNQKFKQTFSEWRNFKKRK
jgi:hypothetical protein